MKAWPALLLLAVAGCAVRDRAPDLERRLDTVRRHLKPYHTLLVGLFAELGEASAGGAQNLEAWAPWLAKAGDYGAKKTLEILIQRGRLSQRQLATLAGVKLTGGHWRRIRAFITGNNLARLDGEDIVAEVLS